MLPLEVPLGPPHPTQPNVGPTGLRRKVGCKGGGGYAQASLCPKNGPTGLRHVMFIHTGRYVHHHLRYLLSSGGLTTGRLGGDWMGGSRGIVTTVTFCLAPVMADSPEGMDDKSPQADKWEHHQVRQAYTGGSPEQ